MWKLKEVMDIKCLMEDTLWSPSIWYFIIVTLHCFYTKPKLRGKKRVKSGRIAHIGKTTAGSKIEIIMEETKKVWAQRVYMFVDCRAGNRGGMREHLYQRDLEKKKPGLLFWVTY